jgi:hypothetical protein
MSRDYREKTSKKSMAQGAGRKANNTINVLRFAPGALLFPPAARGKIGGQKIKQ